MHGMRELLTSGCAAGLVIALCSCAAPTSPAQQNGNSSQPNRAPQAQIVFFHDSSCTPEPGTPCTVKVHAEISDPDGDQISLTWSGCVKGNAADASCTVIKPGDISMTVAADDGHGHVASATATATGRNVPLKAAPQVTLASFDPLRCCPDSPTLEAFGAVDDCTNDHIIEGAATGDCQDLIAFHSSCLEGVWVDVYRTKPSGTCTVTLETKDFWGQIGTTTKVISYGNK